MQHIVIIDDHPLFSSGLMMLLGEIQPVVKVSSYISAEQCLLDCSGSPALAILDYYVPGASFQDNFAQLSERFKCPILVVSASPSPADKSTAESAGAAAFISKNAEPEILLQAVAKVLQGHSPHVPESSTLDALSGFGLTERQVEILLLVSKGCSNKEIAGLIDVSPETVKSHLKTVFSRIEVQSRIEAVEFVRERGMI